MGILSVVLHTTAPPKLRKQCWESLRKSGEQHDPPSPRRRTKSEVAEMGHLTTTPTQKSGCENGCARGRAQRSPYRAATQLAIRKAAPIRVESDMAAPRFTQCMQVWRCDGVASGVVLRRRRQPARPAVQITMTGEFSARHVDLDFLADEYQDRARIRERVRVK